MPGIQYDVTTRNARLDATETSIGTSPTLVFLTGSEPANCAAAETGTRVAVMTLPSDWLANAASGSKALQGVWQTASALATGTMSYARIYDSVPNCRAQFPVTATGGGGVITFSTVSVTAGQPLSITSFTITEGNP